MKTRSAKNKGKRLQNNVRDILLETFKNQLEEDNEETLSKWREENDIIFLGVNEEDEGIFSGEWKREKKGAKKLRQVCRKPYCSQFVWRLGICAKHHRWSQPCSWKGCGNPIGSTGRNFKGFPLCFEHLRVVKLNPTTLEDL